MDSKKTNKRFVIGDIHGRHDALKQVLIKSKFNYENDTLIILGDIVDGGYNTNLVIDELLKIKHTIFIIGNHDMYFMNFLFKGMTPNEWLNQGGANTINSYGGTVMPGEGLMEDALILDIDGVKIPKSHIRFFVDGMYYFELEKMLFVHGGLDPSKDINTQNKEFLMWDRSIIQYAENNMIDKYSKVFIGHTCLTSDTLIYTSSGFCKIKNISNNKILSIKKNKLTTSYIINKQKYIKQTYKIYAHNIIEATKDHKFLVVKNKNFVFKRVDELKKGDELLCPKKINFKGNIQQLVWKNKKSKKGSSIFHPKTLNTNVAYLLGIILGDGSITKYTIDITEHYKTNLKIINDIFVKEFKKCGQILRRKDKKAFRFRIHSLELSKNLDIKHNTEYFLDLISKSTSEIRLSFIAGLIDSDGSINKTITICQKNKIVLDYIQGFLLYEGIHSIIREEKGISYGKKRIWHELRIRSFFKDACFRILPLKYKNRIIKLKKCAAISTRNMRRLFEYGDFISYPIKRIIKNKKCEVYDISVKDTETFIANGICTHNCTQMIDREWISFRCRQCSKEWEKQFVKYTDMLGNPICPGCNSKDVFQTIGCIKPIKTGNLYCLDTGAGWNGRLTIMNIDTDDYWQSQIQEPAILDMKT